MLWFITIHVVYNVLHSYPTTQHIVATLTVKTVSFLSPITHCSVKMKTLLEQLARIYRENEYSADILFTVQDVCGPIYKWPRYIQKVIMSKTFCYMERVKLTTFFWVNGFRNLDGWLLFLVRTKGPAFRRYEAELKTLFKYYHQEEVQRKYFSFCTMHNRYEYLDGSDRDTEIK